MKDAPEDWSRIVDRLLAGDRLAFMKLNRLLTGFLAQLRAYDFREEWEDLRQEVILCVIANARAGRLRDPRKFLGYVRIITRNKFVDRLDRGRRRQEKRTLPWDDETSKSSFLPAAQGADDDRARDVWSAVGGLSAQQQQVVEGVYRQGKTYQQVADDTGIPLGTVKRRLREGLDLLRARLHDAEEDG